MQSLYGEKQIISLLQKIRIFNREIGSYEQFALTENFEYAVKLSNGRLLLKQADLKKDDSNELKPYQLEIIAGRFIPAAVSTTEGGKETNAAGHASSLPGKQLRKVLSFVLMFIVIVLAGLAVMNRSKREPVKIKTNKSSIAGEQHFAARSNEPPATPKPKTTKPNAASWLSAKGNFKKNLWGNKLKAEVNINNHSKTTTFTNLVIRATYLNKDGKQIATRDHTISKKFTAGASETVQLKIENFQHVHSVSWSVVSAEEFH